MIEFKHVHFSYGERPILQDVTFNLNNSESVIIMGPSGSGKSTILRLILGLEFPQQGEILINNESLRFMKEKERREVRKHIGMVFQDGGLFDSLTVGENVGYYLFEHTSLPLHEIEQRVVEMLGFVDLESEEVIDKLPEQLSGGMQRRVAIGRALLSTSPTIMLYDEPTTGLDPQATQKVLGLMNKLTREKSISTIVVTHQIADAFTLADRFMIIYDGMLVFDGNLEKLRASGDERVLEFLEPFRASHSLVVNKGFVNGD
ncbi:MAG: ATP-binding cassette domain-containing protein [candidate division Zixibacteria bacterium]|nr:ATP-binding cassette domain-containing protein [candidate division Zixibacteria bacterium]